MPGLGTTQYPSDHTYLLPRYAQLPSIHTCLGEGAIGLARITGAVGLILTSICAEAPKEKIISNPKSITNLLAYFFMFLCLCF
jgi:hypothetical protein